MIKQILNSLGLLDPIRQLLYRTVRRTTSIDVNGIHRRFITTSSDLHRRVVAVGGEREQLSLFLKSLRPGDVVWDVGSFIGMYSVFASARIGEEGQIVAFEPESTAFGMANANAQANRLENIQVLNVALSDINTNEGVVYSSQENNNAIHSLRQNAKLQEEGQQIQIHRGDDLVAASTIPAPTVIKMDIEGAEFGALSGMVELLKDPTCRFLFLEVHPTELPDFGGSVEKLEKLIDEVGFQVSKKIQRGSEYHYFCYKDQ